MDPRRFRPFFRFDELQTETVEVDVARVVYTGENIQLVEYRFPPHKRFTAHNHPHHEQMGYLASGKMGFIVGSERRILLPGDFYHAPIGQMHNAWTYDEPAVLIDIFSPTRDDILLCSNVWVADVDSGQRRSSVRLTAQATPSDRKRGDSR